MIDIPLSQVCGWSMSCSTVLACFKARRQDELEFLQDLGAWMGSIDMRLSLREMPHLWETAWL